MKYTSIWFFSVCWNFTLVWIIIIWWNICGFDSFSDSEILMPLNHYTYLKNLMSMILYILYEILAFNKSLHIFWKIWWLDSFLPLEIFFLWIIIFFWNFNKFDSLHIHEIYFFLWIIMNCWNINSWFSLRHFELLYTLNHFSLHEIWINYDFLYTISCI